MRLFAFLWLVSFLLALYPVMKADRLRHIRHALVEFSIAADKMVLELKNFSNALTTVSIYITTYKEEKSDGFHKIS